VEHALGLRNLVGSDCSHWSLVLLCLLGLLCFFHILLVASVTMFAGFITLLSKWSSMFARFIMLLSKWSSMFARFIMFLSFSKDINCIRVTKVLKRTFVVITKFRQTWLLNPIILKFLWLLIDLSCFFLPLTNFPFLR
jgi:hypothetical protein